jgi:hypothetical protein
MSQGMKEEPILQTETDKMIPRCVYDKTFMVIFSDRGEWKDRFNQIGKGD